MKMNKLLKKMIVLLVLACGLFLAGLSSGCAEGVPDAILTTSTTVIATTTTSTTTTTLPAPSSVTAIADTLQASITWEAVPGASAYDLYWSNTSGVSKTTGTKIAGVTSPFLHTGLINGLTYYYIFAAVDPASNEGAASAQCSALPQNVGTFDATFNGQGWVLNNSVAGSNGCSINTEMNTNCITVDADGKLLVTGFSENTSGNKDMVLWRFNANGSLDTTFNGTGYNIQNIATGATLDDAGNALAIDQTGRILVAGYTFVTGKRYMAIWRFNSNGTLDTTFNGTGYIARNNAAGGNGDDLATSIMIDGSGKILVSGTSVNGSANSDMAVLRFNENGTLDATFNATGIFVHDNAAGGNGNDYGYRLALDSSSRILVTGSSRASPTQTNMAIWRINSNGTLDTTFNGTGWVTKHGSAGGNVDWGFDLAIDQNGKIVVAGYATTSGSDYAMIVWRYNADGSVDTTFNNGSGHDGYNGTNGTAGGHLDIGLGIALDRLGKIMIVGGSDNSSSNTEFALWRFNADGTQDTPYNGSGHVLQNDTAGGGKDTFGSGINIDAAGRVIAAGFSYYDASHTSMVVWRLK